MYPPAAMAGASFDGFSRRVRERLIGEKTRRRIFRKQQPIGRPLCRLSIYEAGFRYTVGLLAHAETPSTLLANWTEMDVSND